MFLENEFQVFKRLFMFKKANVQIYSSAPLIELNRGIY